MEKKAFKTVDMVRKIRDEMNKELNSKSNTELKKYFQNKAKEANKKDCPVQTPPQKPR